MALVVILQAVLYCINNNHPMPAENMLVDVVRPDGVLADYPANVIGAYQLLKE